MRNKKIGYIARKFTVLTLIKEIKATDTGIIDIYPSYVGRAEALRCF